MNPAASRSFTAASNRLTVSLTEYLLGLVIKPSSAAYAATVVVHAAIEATSPKREFISLTVFLLCPSRGCSRSCANRQPGNGSLHSFAGHGPAEALRVDAAACRRP